VNFVRGADPLPNWTVTHLDGREVVEADYCERTRNGWDFWTVIVVVNTPRWACMRRIKADDVIGEPLMHAL